MRVVCINRDDLDYDVGVYLYDSIALTIGKIYNIVEDETIESGRYRFYDDAGDFRYYYVERFISVAEYRKRKLRRLNEGV